MLDEIFSSNNESIVIPLFDQLEINQINLKVDNLGKENLSKQQNDDFESDFIDLAASNSLQMIVQDEDIILNDIMNINNLVISEVFNGAHIRIKDNGFFYDKWRVLGKARERISSHPSVLNSKQYGIMGSLIKECLFGIVEENNHIFTFFQLENTPWAPGLKNRINHSLDALLYFIGRKNIGPFGKSIHTDKNPIIINSTTY